MLEFAKVPGLTKIFNRDDWKKVFLACGELPDYRESKYSSYFITKDASVRAGKLYYEKNALEKGGYSYDPISHIKLENEKDVTTPEDRSYCFGAGEKYEFNGFILEAKYVPNQRNITPDILLDPTKTYSIKRNNEYKRLTGYTQWTQAKIGTTTYYLCNLGWLGSYGAYTAAINIAGSKVSGLDLYQGKKEIDGEGREVWTFTTINKSAWKGDDTYAPPKFDDESSNIWIKETVSAFETARNAGLVFKAFDPVASLNTLVYDSDIIGHKIINSKFQHPFQLVILRVCCSQPVVKVGVVGFELLVILQPHKQLLYLPNCEPKFSRYTFIRIYFFQSLFCKLNYFVKCHAITRHRHSSPNLSSIPDR